MDPLTTPGIIPMIIQLVMNWKLILAVGVLVLTFILGDWKVKTAMIGTAALIGLLVYIFGIELVVIVFLLSLIVGVKIHEYRETGKIS